MAHTEQSLIHLGTNGASHNGEPTNGHLIRPDGQPLRPLDGDAGIELVVLDSLGNLVRTGTENGASSQNGHGPQPAEPKFDRENPFRFFRDHPELAEFVAEQNIQGYFAGRRAEREEVERREQEAAALAANISPENAAQKQSSSQDTQTAPARPSVNRIRFTHDAMGFRLARGIKTVVNIFDVTKYSLPKKHAASTDTPRTAPYTDAFQSHFSRTEAYFGPKRDAVDPREDQTPYGRALKRQKDAQDDRERFEVAAEKHGLVVIESGSPNEYSYPTTLARKAYLATRGRSKQGNQPELTIKAPDKQKPYKDVLQELPYRRSVVSDAGAFAASTISEALQVPAALARARNIYQPAIAGMEHSVANAREIVENLQDRKPSGRAALTATAVLLGVSVAANVIRDNAPTILTGDTSPNQARSAGGKEQTAALENPLEKFSFVDGSQLMLDLDRIQRQVDLLPKGTTVIIAETIPDQDFRNELIMLTSGKKGITYLDQDLQEQVKSEEEPEEGEGALLLQSFAPESPVQITFERSDGAVVEPMEFKGNFKSLSKTHPVFAEGTIPEIDVQKIKPELLNAAERFNTLEVGTFLIISDWPADADNPYYTYIPGQGPAVNADIAKFSEAERKKIIYQAFAKATFEIYSSHTSEALNQFSDIVQSLSDDALHGLPPEDPTLHHDAFTVLASINGEKPSSLRPPSDPHDEKANKDFEENVFIEAFTALFFNTEGLVAIYDYNTPCSEEQDYTTKQNLGKLLRYTLATIASSDGPAAIQEFYKNQPDLFKQLWINASIIDGSWYSLQTPDTIAKPRDPTSTPRPANTPDLYHSPTPGDLEDMDTDTEADTIWRSAPTLTSTPTLTPQATATPSATPTENPYRNTPTPRPIESSDDNEFSASGAIDMPREVPPSRTPTPTATATPGLSPEQRCEPQGIQTQHVVLPLP